MSRAEALKRLEPHLIAEVYLYPTSQGGRRHAIAPGWGCPCMASKAPPLEGYDAWPLLGDAPLAPGERRELGFYFLYEERSASILREAGTFYLWEGRFIGEARVRR